MKVSENMVPLELQNPTKTYVKISGLGRDSRFERHDPSNIIRFKGKYYLWFTEHPRGTTDKDGGYWIRWATSPDGYTWTLHGKAIEKGQPGDLDEQNALTSYLVPYNGKFYLFYTATNYAEFPRWGITYAVAESPDGPWQKSGVRLLWPSDEESDWDCIRCDDTNIIFRSGKWWLYYKGRSKKSKYTQVGVAVSDNLLGPYQKSPANPLFLGHAFSAWVHRDGVAAVSGMSKIGNMLLWSRDGLNFTVVSLFDNRSTGFY